MNEQKEAVTTDDSSHTPEIDISNKFGVGVRGDGIVVLSSPRWMTAEDAMVYAAWIVALATMKAKHPFSEYYDRVCET